MKRFVLCGTGWRAGFYVRVASALAEKFEIVAIYTRSRSRAEELSSNGIFVTNDLNLALEKEHDAVIVASGKDGFLSLLKELSRRGETILSETAFSSLDNDSLSVAENIEGYTLEQYWHTPLFSSVYTALPYIGKIESVYLSGLHNHHAASICRRLFPYPIFSSKTILERNERIRVTGDRGGLTHGTNMEERLRTIKMIEYEQGIFINDFTKGQYHDYRLCHRIEIRGEKGVIDERGVTYIDDEGYPIDLPFVFNRSSNVFSFAPTLTHISLGDRIIYKNEYYKCAFSDDEIAIAHMLSEFAEGRFGYSFKDGVEDARVGALL